MKHCPNLKCPYFESIGTPAEYMDEIEVCSDCGTKLAWGEVAKEKKETPAPPPPLTVVGSFWEPSQAHLAKSKLEAEGITAFLIDENMNRMYSQLIGLVKLAVPEPEAEKALKIIAEDHTGEVVQNEASMAAIKDSSCCPKCASQEVSLLKASPNTADHSFLVRQIINLFRKRYQCQKCGHQWK